MSKRAQNFGRWLGIFLLLSCVGSLSHAANKYWISASTGNWNNANNWSATSGGAGGAGVPGATDNAVFDGVRQGSCTININVSISSITISTSVIGGFARNVIALSTISITTNLDFAISNGTFTAQSSTMAISGNILINGGYFSNVTSSITVGGNWSDVAAASFLPGTSTVTFISSSAQTITNAGKNFNNVNFNGSGSWVLQDSMTVVSTMTLANGTLDTSAANCSGTSCNMAVGGSWYETNGSFLTNTSTITFNSATAQKFKPAVIPSIISNSIMRPDHG